MTEPSDDRARYRAPVGTHDVLPPESAQWTALVAAFAERAGRYGFDLVVTPIFEHLDVFERVGGSTDVVRKEMYDFDDKGGRRLALRPEGTAPVVRAFVQHRPPVPWKVWYVAPHFRYERPQKGRYRQHWQVGAEVLGVDDPDVDVEVIALAHGFYRDLGLQQVSLIINSMGDEQSRPAYLALLREYLLAHAGALGDDFRERVEANPLRVLDSKREDWQDVIERAPQLTEHLSDASREEFEQVQRRLDALGIRYELDPRLVRGFDYYTGTTFEFQSGALDAAQNAIGGGGRYDQVGRGDGRAAHHRHRLRHRHRAGAHRVRRRARGAGHAGRRRRVRGQRPGYRRRRRGHVARQRAPRRRHAHRAHVRCPVGEGAVEGRGEVGRVLTA